VDYKTDTLEKFNMMYRCRWETSLSLSLSVLSSVLLLCYESVIALLRSSFARNLAYVAEQLEGAV